MKELDRRIFVFPFSVRSAKFNMEMDIKFFNDFFKERTGLRIYGWSERCITFGRNQKIPQTSLPSVKRPTGGGIVVHSTDISFSFFINPSSPLWRPSVHSTYLEISELIKESLRRKGYQVDYPREIHHNRERREMCFERAEPHELVLDGRKVMGCALLKNGKRYLAQGTIFLSVSGEKLEKVLTNVLKEKGFEIHILTET